MNNSDKNINQLFDKARNAPVKLTPEQIQAALVSSSTWSALAIIKSISKFKMLSIMLGSTVAIVAAVIVMSTKNEIQNPSNENFTGQYETVIEPKENSEQSISTRSSKNEEVTKDEIHALEPTQISPIDISLGINQSPPVNQNMNVLKVKKESKCFHSVVINIPAEVELLEGEQCKMEVLEEDLADLILLTVNNGVLTVDLKKGENKLFYKRSKRRTVNLKLTMSSLQSVISNGSGNIYSNADIASDNLDIQLNGSGDVQLNKIHPSTYDIQLTGSGDVVMKAEGKSSRGTIMLTGSGDVLTANLVSDDVQVNITGSGDALVAAVKTLNVNIDGSGDLNYKGNPETHVSITGSGEVQKRE